MKRLFLIDNLQINFLSFWCGLLYFPAAPKKVATVTARQHSTISSVLNVTWTMPTNQICPVDNYTITTRLIRRLHVSTISSYCCLKDYFQIQVSSFYGINKGRCPCEKLKSRILTYSDFALAGCAQLN